MSGVYGTLRGANFNPSEHAEVFVSYRANRNSADGVFSDKTASDYLVKDSVVDGVYQLKLPVDTFNAVGIYNVYIRPKQTIIRIKDVGVLDSYPNIRGIIIDSENFINDSLIGYRVEYKQDDVIIPNLFRIITSNNKCELTSQQKTYRFNDNSSLMFLTLSPSTASNSRPNQLPFIGNANDTIVLSNTFFDPQLIEIEMVENDIDTLYTSLNGNQIRNLDNGLVTTYNDSNQIVRQIEHYVIKESETGKPIYEVRQNKNDIDSDEKYNDIVSTVG